MINGVVFNFLLLFFEIFAVDVEIIWIICRKKYELLNKSQLYENYLKMSMKLYGNEYGII